MTIGDFFIKEETVFSGNKGVVYWTNIGMELIKKGNITKASAIAEIIKYDDFQKSGVSEEALSLSMSNQFEQQRRDIYEQFKKITKIDKSKNE